MCQLKERAGCVSSMGVMVNFEAMAYSNKYKPLPMDFVVIMIDADCARTQAMDTFATLRRHVFYGSRVTVLGMREVLTSNMVVDCEGCLQILNIRHCKTHSQFRRNAVETWFYTRLFQISSCPCQHSERHPHKYFFRETAYPCPNEDRPAITLQQQLPLFFQSCHLYLTFELSL